MSDRIIYDIPDCIPGHEAYGYSWNIYKKIGDEPKPYVGYKSEQYNGTYDHSSDCEIFLEDMRKAEKIVFKLEYFGKTLDTADWEDNYLSTAKNANKLSEMYNKTGFGAQAKSDRRVKELYKDYLDGKLDKYKKQTPFTILLWLYQNGFRLQGREFDDIEHQKSVTAQINKNQGNLEQCVVITFKDYYGKGIDKIIDGNTTIPSIEDSKIYKKYKKKNKLHLLEVVNYNLPKSVYGKLKKSDSISFAQMVNPRKEIRKKETSEGDAVKSMKTRKKYDNIDFDSIQNINLYSGPGYHFTHDEIKRLADKAAKQWRIEQKQEKGNKLANPAAPHIKKIKEDKIKKLKKNPYSIVVGFTTGNFKWGNIWYEIITQLEKKPKATEIIFVISYSLPGVKDTVVDDWTKKKKSKVHKALWKEVEKRYDLEIKEEYMSRYDKNGEE